MLELTVGAPSAAPPASAADGSDIVEWLDHDGGVAAWGFTTDDLHHMVVPGVGVFAFGDDHTVQATPEPAAEPELVADGFRRIVLPIALQALGVETLHASAVLSDRGVIAFCGHSTAGKSTVAYALSRRGHPLWADDAVAVVSHAGRFVVEPLPFQLRLRADSRQFLGIANGQALPYREPASDEPLAAICVLETRDQAEPSVERFAPSEAFCALLEHAYCFSLSDPERKRRMVSHYLELSACVPVLAVSFARGLDRLEESLDLIEAAVAEAAG